MSSLFQFSAVAERMQPSPIRELFQMIRQPGMISFAGGLPDPSAFPVGPFADCADVLSRDGREVLQYGASEGYPPLREKLLAMMADRLGFEVMPDQLLITSGSQQAANLIARVLLDPGDVVIVEAPTYPGTIHSLRNAGARFATVPCDADGMQVELLPEIVDRTEAEQVALFLIAIAAQTASRMQISDVVGDQFALAHGRLGGQQVESIPRIIGAVASGKDLGQHLTSVWVYHFCSSRPGLSRSTV